RRQQDVDGLGEGPGGDGEIDGAELQHHPPQRITQDRRDGDAAGYRQPKREMVVADEEARGVGADRSKGLMRQRELSGEARKQIPASSEDHVIEADGEEMEEVGPGEERCEEHERRDHDCRGQNAAQIEESADAFVQPSKHSWMSSLMRGAVKSRGGPSALMRPRLTM